MVILYFIIISTFTTNSIIGGRSGIITRDSETIATTVTGDQPPRTFYIRSRMILPQRPTTVIIQQNNPIINAAEEAPPPTYDEAIRISSK